MLRPVRPEGPTPRAGESSPPAPPLSRSGDTGQSGGVRPPGPRRPLRHRLFKIPHHVHEPNARIVPGQRARCDARGAPLPSAPGSGAPARAPRGSGRESRSSGWGGLGSGPCFLREAGTGPDERSWGWCCPVRQGQLAGTGKSSPDGDGGAVRPTPGVIMMHRVKMTLTTPDSARYRRSLPAETTVAR